MKRQNHDSLAVARRIRAAGRPIYIAEDDGTSRYLPCDGLLVRQTGGVMESRAIDCGGGTAFVIYVVITNKLPRFAIAHFGLELPWHQEHFYWLEDPLEIDGTSRSYRFHGNERLEFDRHLVLNHQVGVMRILSPADSLKGFLLGYGFEPIPGDFGHGAMVPAFVVIYDQFGSKYRAGVQLQVVRRPKRPASGRKGSLLDHPDAVIRCRVKPVF
jgi:hypothetical protein